MNIKTRLYLAKNAVKEKTAKAWQWCKENPEYAIAIGGAILSGGKYLGKAAIKHKNIKDEEDVKNLYCYDRSLGHYWKLRRELRNDEWLEIDKRKQNGERLSDILDSLKVLE